MLYISLATCNIEPLIEEVLNSLYRNTTLPFYLCIADNESRDKTVDIVKGVLAGWGDKCVDCSILKTSSRVVSTDIINLSFRPLLTDLAGESSFTQVTKLDHDYGVPADWDTTLERAFRLRPDLHLLCPSVHYSTPKGMQYYSQKHEPEKKSYAEDLIFYHYTGIAGYAHTWRYSDFKRLILGGDKVYKPLNAGAVFGSEDADMSLRCKNLWPGDSNAYVFNLAGMHWDKPVIGKYEEQWKADATFKRTMLQWEEWKAINVPEGIEG